MRKSITVRKANRKKHEKLQTKALRTVLTYVKDNNYSELSGDDRKILNNTLSELCIRERLPFKHPPKSWRIWGPVYFLTFNTPQIMAIRKYDVSKRIVEAVRTIIRQVLNEAFSEDGRYTICFYCYPHRSTTSTKHSFLHFHCVVGAMKFLNADKKPINHVQEWSSLSESVKMNRVYDFFTAPMLQFDRKTTARISSSYNRKLELLFGKKVMGESLVWVRDCCQLSDKAHKTIGRYMLNPILTVFKRRHIRYDNESVYSRNMISEDEEEIDFGPAYRFKPLDFAKRFVIRPLRGFYRLRFYAQGGYHGRNGFNVLLKYVHDHPEVASNLGWDDIPTLSMADKEQYFLEQYGDCLYDERNKDEQANEFISQVGLHLK